MYRTTIQPTASRLAAASVTTALLLSLCSPFAALASADTGVGTDHSKTVTTEEVTSALSHTSGILQSSDSVVATSSDAQSVLRTDDGSVNIPKDASSGVTLSSESGPSLDITLPGADQAGDGQQVAPGVVAYSSNNGSANAVQAEDDGSVRMLTVIDNKSAPRTYDYKITVPEGGVVHLTKQGGAIVFDELNNPVASVDAPWATDAKGNQVKTWFTTDGQTLTQHIMHNLRGTTYPVAADPLVRRWYGADYEFNRNQTNNVMLGTGGSAIVAAAIPEPTASKALASILGGATVYAGWIYNRGGCLKISFSYVGTYWIGGYYGGNCR